MLLSDKGPPSRDISSQISQAALNDDDPTVRCQAMLTAAWTRQTWLLEQCRKLSKQPSTDNWDAILLLAILSRPTDLDRIIAVGKTVELGPQRFKALGACGHPDVMEILFQAIQSEDPLTAVAAGEAFTKITGKHIDSDKIAQLPPEDDTEPDEFEQEFLEEVTLPDPASAQNHWQEVKDNFSSGTRWCCGFNLNQPVGKEILDQLDMESRWHACLRGMFEGTWQASPIDLEVFPQKSTASLPPGPG
jgi:hypothetical protein